MRTYFYKKERKKIVAAEEPLHELAKAKLRYLYANRNQLQIPRRYIEHWDKVSLYHPSGNVDKANAILINPDEGAYTIDNKLNDLTGKDWVKFSCSWFIFNALAADLKAEKELDPDIEHHPATFSPTMITDFIKFFTKAGDTVLDPFLGIGSTTEAAKRTDRIGYGIEVNPKYYELALKRTPEFTGNIFNIDAREIDKVALPEIDFSISSPPYWDILNRSTKDFKKDRTDQGFDYTYSESEIDIGNIADYEGFLKAVCDIYLKVYKVLRNGAYNVIIVKNVKKGGKMYPLAWDIARELGKTYVLKDEKIWIQDKVALAPYGYPFSWSSNILHHYCIILRKEQ